MCVCVCVCVCVCWRMQAIRYVVNQMDRYLLAQREYRTGCMVRIKHFIAKLCCLVGGKLYGNYLISGYMAVICARVTHGGRDSTRRDATPHTWPSSCCTSPTPSASCSCSTRSCGSTIRCTDCASSSS